ncbi:hypothetical protein OPV22_035176 [Ensete ventricosum]|uniref:Uncharacterized protein n=1 Tax=Ensete ventricosum TaxID=4639 RepID=A0AAX5NIA4_ENSVE|nr:hypothetical protein OPV22_035176 [Ensete ventricosum]
MLFLLFPSFKKVRLLPYSDGLARDSPILVLFLVRSDPSSKPYVLLKHIIHDLLFKYKVELEVVYFLLLVLNFLFHTFENTEFIPHANTLTFIHETDTPLSYPTFDPDSNIEYLTSSVSYVTATRDTRKG